MEVMQQQHVVSAPAPASSIPLAEWVPLAPISPLAPVLHEPLVLRVLTPSTAWIDFLDQVDDSLQFEVLSILRATCGTLQLAPGCHRVDGFSQDGRDGHFPVPFRPDFVGFSVAPLNPWFPMLPDNSAPPLLLCLRRVLRALRHYGRHVCRTSAIDCSSVQLTRGLAHSLAHPRSLHPLGPCPDDSPALNLLSLHSERPLEPVEVLLLGCRDKPWLGSPPARSPRPSACGAVVGNTSERVRGELMKTYPCLRHAPRF